MTDTHSGYCMKRMYMPVFVWAGGAQAGFILDAGDADLLCIYVN